MIQYLRDESRKNSNIYIFGCGKTGTRIFKMLVMSGIIIRGFFDNAYSEGIFLKDKNVLPLHYLEHCDKKHTYIVVASWAVREINDQLRKSGIIHIINLKDLAIKYHSDFPLINFNTSVEPQVSILVTAYNEWRYSYNCMESLAEHKIAIPYEIIFGEDASSDLSKEAEKYFNGVQVIHNQKTMNYLANVNNIAKFAKGEFIVLLANDTVVIQDYWIDKMVEIMNRDKSIGMISGKYWVPMDGEYDYAFNYGDNWEELRLNEKDGMQSVEFVKPIASMIRKSVWDKIGGFSDEFLPAYREDNDLCMKIISSGFKCIYTPDIETIHFAGTSYGKRKDCQELLRRNFELFTEKWKLYKQDRMIKSM
jgi:GT2 family glycosyltransferase